MAQLAGRRLQGIGRYPVALVVVLAVAGCDPWRSSPRLPESRSPGSYDVRRQRFQPEEDCPPARPNTLRVGVKWDIPHFGLADKRERTWQGLDVDMAKEVANRLSEQLKSEHRLDRDLDVILVGTKTDDRVPYLDPRDCVDVVFSTFTKTVERCHQVDCSESYFIVRQRFLTRKSYAKTLTPAAAANTRNGVCTTQGSTGIGTMDRLHIGNRKTPRLFSTCVRWLRKSDADSKKVDAVLGDDANLLGYLLSDPDHLKFSGPPLPETLPGARAEYVAAVKKGRSLEDTPLVVRLNEILLDMENEDKTKQICEKWVGFLWEGTCDAARRAS